MYCWSGWIVGCGWCLVLVVLLGGVCFSFWWFVWCVGWCFCVGGWWDVWCCLLGVGWVFCVGLDCFVVIVWLWLGCGVGGWLVLSFCWLGFCVGWYGCVFIGFVYSFVW